MKNLGANALSFVSNFYVILLLLYLCDKKRKNHLNKAAQNIKITIVLVDDAQNICVRMHMNVHGKIPSWKFKPQQHKWIIMIRKLLGSYALNCEFSAQTNVFVCCCVHKMGSESLPPACIPCVFRIQYTSNILRLQTYWSVHALCSRYCCIEQFLSTYFIDFIFGKEQYSIANDSLFSQMEIVHIDVCTFVVYCWFWYGVWHWHVTFFPLGSNQ